MALRRQGNRYISYSAMESGMIVRFAYEGKQRIVLVIDPFRLNEHANENQLHGIDISNFSNTELLNIAETFGVNLSYEEGKTFTTGLNTTDAYMKYKSSQFVSTRKYRTYNVSKISQLRQVVITSK